jgi:hypothetical protein
MRWNPSAILLCISFTAKDAEPLFVYLLAICSFSFESCPIHLPIH